MLDQEPSSYPDFDDLPAVKNLPQGCAWGIFDNNDEKDVFGTLNFLTPRVIRSALKEACHGTSVSLNWPLDGIRASEYGRKGLESKKISWASTPYRFNGFDDEVSFNTQCSSQWDSLVHYAHQSTNLYYNGLHASLGDFELKNSCNQLPTLNHWHKRGGLVGRGVLVDYKRWADSHGVIFDPHDTHKITIQDIEEVVTWQSTEFHPGDILIIRSGYVRSLAAASDREQRKLLESGKCCGVENTVSAARWLWNQRFSAVAGDMMGFEVCPPVRPDGGEGTMSEYGMFIITHDHR